MGGSCHLIRPIQNLLMNSLDPPPLSLEKKKKLDFNVILVFFFFSYVLDNEGSSVVFQ